MFHADQHGLLEHGLLSKRQTSGKRRRRDLHTADPQSRAFQYIDIVLNRLAGRREYQKMAVLLVHIGRHIIVHRIFKRQMQSRLHLKFHQLIDLLGVGTRNAHFTDNNL
ncbi:hypothetical protein D3C71_1963190 [compost metagenome]